MSGSSADVCKFAYVLDAAGFFAGLELSLPGPVYTTENVLKEVKDRKSLKSLELAVSAGKVAIKSLSRESLTEVKEVAKNLGELERLSKTDLGLLALVKELLNICEKVIVVSDDRSVQNVSLALGAEVQGIKRKPLKGWRKYVYICPSCGRIYDKPGVCPYCGTPLKRVKLSKAHEIKKRVPSSRAHFNS